MSEQRNLIVAILLSVVILIGFHLFYEQPRQEAQRAMMADQVARQQASEQVTTTPGALPGAAPTATTAPASRTRGEVLQDVPRVRVATPTLHGSIATVGGRIDDLTLADYHLTPDPKSPEIVLLSPVGSDAPFYAEFGWIPAGPGVAVPDGTTVWEAEGGPLAPNNPVTLRWDNGAGLVFERVYEVDAGYMFKVTQRVINETDAPVSLRPYGLVARHGTPATEGLYLLHEGPLGVLDGTLREFDYTELQEDADIVDPARGVRAETATSTGGWLGITDKYWLTALVPDQQAPLQARFVFSPGQGGRESYQVDYLREPVTVAPGEAAEVSDRLFAGAKVVRLLDAYEDQLGIKNFDRAIDFGLFYWLTKPIFLLLDAIYGVVGNFGVAILVLTLIIKAILFPLANKSYKAMSRMKALQPKINALRERVGDDRQRMSQEMMELYKREKVNPASGCLPILVQIPVFFALYKVLYVTIEMRHAPFFGWIRDLSAPDPTNVFNLFGLIPFDPGAFLHVGIWPIIMGLTMWLQQKLNPQPTDPTQAKVFMILPFVFTFMLASFPAGLVIYWAWNNALSILQQWAIMRRMGVKATA